MPTWGLSRGDSYEVELVRLDSFLEQNEIDLANLYGSTGLLWLDVEGVGLHSLQGMPNTLSSIAMAKIEIQYGKQEGQWAQSNIFQVVRIMIRKGFMPRKGYLHPLARGDMFFVRRKHANIWEMTKAICYLLTAILFYGEIYPLWWKISNRSKAA